MPLTCSPEWSKTGAKKVNKGFIMKTSYKSPRSKTTTGPGADQQASDQVLLRRDLEKKRHILQKKLDMIKEYKQLLAADGMHPDAADKAKESLIIQQLLGLQKDQARLEKTQKPTASKLTPKASKAGFNRPSHVSPVSTSRDSRPRFKT